MAATIPQAKSNETFEDLANKLLLEESLNTQPIQYISSARLRGTVHELIAGISALVEDAVVPLISSAMQEVRRN